MRTFLQLAHPLKNENLAGWFVSEKLDGMRCFWDGGISRGIKKDDIPFANLNKDYRYKQKQIATGLWSRYGNVIHAPDWFLDSLPKMMLDGELYIDRGDGPRQELMSIVKDLIPGDGWRKVRYYVFDSPPVEKVFANGLVKETNFTKQFVNVIDWATKLGVESVSSLLWFKVVYEHLIKNVPVNQCITVHMQTLLPMDYEQTISNMLTKITDAGGEGLIVRNPSSRYACERTHNMVKIKKLSDAEGTVIGYVSGRETDKGSKLLGMLGALVLNYNGKRLELSGFTDQERLLYAGTVEWAKQNPGKQIPDEMDGAISFPVGSVVTFRYRGESKDGIPQEARFWRRKVSE